MSSSRIPTAEALVAWVHAEYRTQFRESAERLALPLDERIEAGSTIAGLRVVESVKRRTRLHTTLNLSKLRVGDLIHLHPESEAVDLATAMKGSGWGPKLTARSDDGLDLEVDCPLDPSATWCIDTLPAAWSPLSAQPAAVCAGLEADHPLATRWRRWLTGATEASAAGAEHASDLTVRQQEALHRALHDEVAVIQGPPGTGKTHLIAAIIERLVDDGQRVLVTCFSHAAIDNVLLAVQRRNPRIPCSRVKGPTELPGVTALTSLPSRTEPGVYGMTVFAAAGPWTKPLIAAAGKIERPADGGPLTASMYAHAYAQAWAVAELPDPCHLFDVTVIDEASQMGLPQALMALLNGRRCIAVGDHRQLPPVAKVTPSFATSLFDQLVATHQDRAVMLDRTFRMHAAICDSPSRLFYAGKLLPHESIAGRQPPPVSAAPPAPPWVAACFDPQQPVIFVAVPSDTGTDGNEAEADVVGTLAAHALACGWGSSADGLAVVCAHRRQNLLVRAATAAACSSLPAERQAPAAKALLGMLCDTVERIQGQERDCILISLTGSDPEHLANQWSFSHCPRRFNVSITRPRARLIVVGSPSFFHFTPSDGGDGDENRLTGLAALKRWYLDRLDAGQVVTPATA